MILTDRIIELDKGHVGSLKRCAQSRSAIEIIDRPVPSARIGRSPSSSTGAILVIPVNQHTCSIRQSNPAMICGQKKRPFVIAGIVDRSSRTKIRPTENIDPGRLDLIPELINQTTSPGLLCGTDHVDMAVSSRSRTL